MTNLRTKGKSTIVWILMGLLILGLGGFGVTSFTSGSSDIGSVGKTKVDGEDYARAMRSELNSYSQQAGERLTMEQAQAMGLQQSVQSQLFTAAALQEEARRIGVSVGDQRVVQSISDAPAFQGPNGSFDRTAYSQILAREGLTEPEFEQKIREDEARMLLHRAVSAGVASPATMVEQTVEWLLQTRDISWYEITEAELTMPVSEPDEETLKAWHSANAERFTAPEKRKLSYVWLTPEMLVDEVDLDEQALRDAYEERINQYRQPERRMVGRLVFPSAEDAQSAKDRLDAGELSFDDLVAERGLTLEDIDLGEVTRNDMGQAGDAVFAMEQPGVIGPLQTDLGAALFSMNGILEAVDVSFEEAKEELGSEAAVDRAARMIESQMSEYEDMLASGATLEDVAEETPMEFGTLDWSSDMEPEEQSIAGYNSFRDIAEAIGEDEFPAIERLEDGGIFALRLDEITPPTLIPFEEIRDRVAEDWRREELKRLLLARAEEVRLGAVALNNIVDRNAENGDDIPAAETPADEPASPEQAEPEIEPVGTPLDWTSQTGLTRDGWIEGLPHEIVSQAFSIAKPGDIEIADAGGRVFLFRLDEIGAADQKSEEATRIAESVKQRISQSLQNDIFSYYTQAVQRNAGISVNQAAIDAINAQVQ
ncbi:SurA N-terminal domain-containing protein [Paracoccus onubensis]|uniref:SurA N-terminal domain-containing protein n=1 Tax=Paracoccus onubensis TaxID=1675788 RepID=UPI001E39DEA7|nr:SurA N-terminal domain-containing protein [Paracoccus onubensis]